VVEEVFTFLTASAPASIEMRLRVADEIGAVYADATQLHQVLMNLGANAFHAMQETGGEFVASVEEVALPRDFSELHPRFKGERAVQLTVSDSGKGLDPETADRMFEPFFTTKAVGEGTGLGLSVLHGIVQAHGGVIAVTSAVDEGTTIEIRLPIHPSEPEEPPRANRESREVQGRILVVDDDVAVGELLQMTLEALGHTVMVQTDSDAALAHFQQHAERYDLVITDQMMPRLTGPALAAAMIDVRPDMRIILMSGYPGDHLATAATGAHFVSSLPKPFDRGHLAAAIQTALVRLKAEPAGDH
jgi:CheY-like chemotaxis protein